MAVLKPLGESSAYGGMIGRLWPRGPIWDPSQAGLGGLTAGLALEAMRFHNRLVQLMREAFPETADELLAEWEAAYGLPLCTDSPTTTEGRRLALAGRVASQGGQSRGYYIDLAWRVLEADGEYVRADDPEGVWVEERPFGDPFVAWGSNAWELLGTPGAPFYWILHLPDGVSAEKTAVIECLVCRYKPAHTVLVRANGTVVCETPGEPDPPTELGVYYHLPGSGDFNLPLSGTGDALVSTTSTAADMLTTSCSLVWWMRANSADEGGNVLEVMASSVDQIQVYFAAGGAFILDLSVSNGSHVGVASPSAGIPFGQWDLYSVEIGADGVGRIYRNASVICTTSGTPPGPGEVTPVPGYLRFQAFNGNAADIANIMPLSRVLTADERSALYAAGPQHDYRESTGDWAGVASPPVYWRDADVGGIVPNAGVAGTCGLELQGDATTEEF